MVISRVERVYNAAQKVARARGMNALRELETRIAKIRGFERPPPAECLDVDDGPNEVSTVENFHKLYYNSPARTWGDTHWLHTPTQKNPLDMWVYQEIITSIEPDFIIETGTAAGGSALFMAHILDIIGKGKVLTIDIAGDEVRPRFAPRSSDHFRQAHPRIFYVQSSSTDPRTVKSVKKRVQGAQTVLVILDSDHSRDHVLNELRSYSGLVTPGSYLIVEDTNVNGHPVRPDHGPGPMEALQDFLQENRDFEIDASKEKFFFTQNPKGFLKRKYAP